LTLWLVAFPSVAQEHSRSGLVQVTAQWWDGRVTEIDFEIQRGSRPAQPLYGATLRTEGVERRILSSDCPAVSVSLDMLTQLNIPTAHITGLSPIPPGFQAPYPAVAAAGNVFTVHFSGAQADGWKADVSLNATGGELAQWATQTIAVLTQCARDQSTERDE